MITKSLIAAAAVAVSLTALAPVQQAQADSFDIDVNLGGFGGGFGGGYGGGYGGGDYYPVEYPYYGGKSCWQVKQKLKMMNFKHVNPFDCSAPVYQYTAKKMGNPVKIKANWHGHIISVKWL